MTNNLHIRDARTDDRVAIQEVTLAAYEQYAPAMGQMWQYYRNNMFETLADIQPAEQIVAETQDGIVGTVLLYPAGTQFHVPSGRSATLLLPEVRLLAVPPSERGRGIASALMQECIRRARQAGVAALTLHTSDIMNVAMQMYERMGFVRDPERDFRRAPNVVVKAFRLDLSRAPTDAKLQQ